VTAKSLALASLVVWAIRDGDSIGRYIAAKAVSAAAAE
jgi:hypothetical protein